MENLEIRGYLEYLFRQAQVQYREDFEVAHEVDIGADLAADVAHVLGQVGAVVGEAVGSAAPEQQAAVEGYVVVVVALDEAAAIAEA
ncbi:MAG: hypothetical protein IJ200_09225 [Prevotella sp.]|nr:hypothetical protein [Prevotella sp.]